ncbi:hypothetical protein W269_01363, partial [Staphylococcus aureus DAR2026]
MSDMLEIFLIGFGVYLFYRIAIIFLKSKKTIHTNIYEMLMLATIFMISTIAYKHQKTHILIAFLVMFFMSIMTFIKVSRAGTNIKTTSNQHQNNISQTST